MAVDGSGWHWQWMAMYGSGWQWMAVDGSGWQWMAVEAVAVNGIERH